jgi:hypothetical protein
MRPKPPPRWGRPCDRRGGCEVVVDRGRLCWQASLNLAGRGWGKADVRLCRLRAPVENWNRLYMSGQMGPSLRNSQSFITCSFPPGRAKRYSRENFPTNGLAKAGAAMIASGFNPSSSRPAPSRPAPSRPAPSRPPMTPPTFACVKDGCSRDCLVYRHGRNDDRGQTYVSKLCRVVHVWIGPQCRPRGDGRTCAFGSKCDVGTCGPPTQKSCDDNNPCTMDDCDVRETVLYDLPHRGGQREQTHPWIRLVGFSRQFCRDG